ncbi:MAG TPA: polysaccharide deacetylase family protein [Candidatus Tectomicrobia bacterium]|nr:polysaccharide deacetylase family protein [Candidatus Tectomicrobia bacterium]
MPVERSYVFPDLHHGMDHDHYEWSPLNANRAALAWPGNARVALCVIVNLGHVEWRHPPGSYQPPNLAGGYGPGPFPDVTAWSHREYGHRVGIFRVLDVLDRHRIRPTVAMDVLTVENYPFLVRHCLGRGDEIIAHGVSVSQMITSRMSEPQEREYIKTAVQALTHATGKAPGGWLGPEYGESTRTPRLLAEFGLRYVCDWVNDEQPYALKVPQGELYALPIALPVDDVNALWDRRVDIDRYRDMLKETFETLYDEGSATGRLLVLHLHPWLVGQPFRIACLDEALGHIMQRSGVWAATGAEIIDWYRSHRPGAR